MPNQYDEEGAPRFDAGPLLAQADLRIRLWGQRRAETMWANDAHGMTYPSTDREVGALLGVSARTVMRWRGGQQLRLNQADECAIRLGLHPALLWPEWMSLGLFGDPDDDNDVDYDELDDGLTDQLADAIDDLAAECIQ